jgi:tyrosine-protein kinase Etk/Wzc
MNENQQLSSFLVTSLRPGEGKSLTVSNLAITFAQQKISTLLIDGDLRRGVLHNVYGNNKKPGLGDFLISKATVDYDNVSKLIQKTIIPNLYLITAGTAIPNPTEMLGSQRMSNLLNVLKSRFGMLILDTAPFQASSDAAILSSSVGGILVVVRAEHTNVEMLDRKLREYRNIHENVLGLVLNMVKTDMKKERYQYSYYNY